MEIMKTKLLMSLTKYQMEDGRNGLTLMILLKETMISNHLTLPEEDLIFACKF